MAIDREFLNGLLHVTAPFRVKEARVDEAAKRLDVWVAIELPRSWFGAARSAGDARERHWRHVNVGAYQCFVHGAFAAGIDLTEQSWAGDDKLGFTRAMAKQVFALLSEGVSYDGICSFLEIQFEDLWKFKFALDSGSATPELKGRVKTRAHMQSAPAATATISGSIAAAPSVAAPASMATATDGTSGVPDVTDPVWQELAEGRFNMDIRVLSLQLMLTRLRSQFAAIQDNDVRLLKLRDLHRYITKNERVLGHELAQLRSR